MIHPGVPAPNLAPLLGRDTAERRGEVEYRAFTTRSLLNRCDSPRMPFEWTVNPYRGCAMGCRYCYAAYTHEYLGSSVAEDFHASIYVKRDEPGETARRLASAIRRGERIALGTATDPYQPGEAEEGVTRRFLELVAQHRGVRLGITTKGAVILRDLELLRRIHERGRLSIHVSLISLDAALLRRLEPWAPPPTVRLEVLRRLAEAGLDVGLSVSPVLPALTDREADLDALLARRPRPASGGSSSTLLFLRSPTKEKYLRWLGGRVPALPRGLSPRLRRPRLSGRCLSRADSRADRTAAPQARLRSHSQRQGGHGPLRRPPAQLSLWSSTRT